MTVTIDGYFSTVNNSATTFWNGVAADHVGQWLVVIHAVAGGSIIDMETGDPGEGLGWPRGAWQLLTQIDAGDGFPKMRVWATRFTDLTSRSLKVPVGSGVNNHSHLYFLSGLRGFDEAERVFSVGAVKSADSATSQPLPLYAPDASGLLIGAWISGTAAVNYTSLNTLTARAEVDGSVSTSRAGEETISARGPGTRTATASAAHPWAAVSIVARDAAGSVTFPTQPLGGRTELALGANPDADPATWAGLWTDISTDVNLRDKITITRGRGDEASTSQPSTMNLTLNNTAGKYVRLNPTGPYYGLLNKNTPVRQWVDPGSGMDVRYTGFVSEWPPRSQGGQIDEHMPIAAAGITRRLAQGQALRSPLYRSITTSAVFDAYYPLEADGSSGIPGGQPMILSGPFSFGDGPPGSAGAISFDSAGTATARVPGVTGAAGWSVSWFLEIPADFDDATDFSIMVNWLTPGATGFNQFFAYVAPGMGGKLAIDGFDFGTSELAAAGGVDLRGRGQVFVVAHGLDIGGGNVSFGVAIFGTDFTDGATVLSAPGSITAITSFGINGYQSANDNPATKGTVSHLFARNGVSGSFGNEKLVPAGAGYAGERAAARIRRLSNETGVPAVVVGDDGASAPMGPQPIGTLLDIWRDVEATDGGVLYEQRDGRVAYQPRTARFNATAALTLDYAAEHLAPPLEPTDDDLRSRNDWEMSRAGGGSARVIDQASKDTIGEYDDSATVNVADDDQLLDEAGWRVHLGTVDDLRFPSVTPNLRGEASALIPSWVSCDIGDAAQITNPGRDLQPGTIDLFAEGYTEAISVKDWQATANCSPGRPWKVGVLDDAVLACLDTAGSATTASFNAGTATSMTVATTSGPLWTTDVADFPLQIEVSGVVLEVTAISGTSSPQTFTITAAPVNGVVKTIPAGEAVRPRTPLTLSL